MHTYRDAIPRARSVWILYPSTEFRLFTPQGPASDSPESVLQDHEGVGAIPLTPRRDAGLLREVLKRLVVG